MDKISTRAAIKKIIVNYSFVITTNDHNEGSISGIINSDAVLITTNDHPIYPGGDRDDFSEIILIKS